MNEVIAAAAELQSFCQSSGWRYCFIGGIALLRWGQPRETVDADLALLTGYGGEDEYIEPLLQAFRPRIANARDFAIQNRTLLLQSRTGVGLDVSLAALPYEETVIHRSTDFEFPSHVVLRTCLAEDLIVLKCFANRGQDWVDVENVIVRQSGRLDWTYIREQLRPLANLKGEPEILVALEDRKRSFETP